VTTALDIFGTDEPPAERRALRAGPLAAGLEAGALRDVTWHGVLLLRAVSWLLRDESWGTPALDVTDVGVEEADGRFALSWTLSHDGPAGALEARARVECEASAERGRLRLAVEAVPSRDVLTNRLGLVVLHPDGLAGLPLLVGHADGTEEATAFPPRIIPDQPATDIVTLAHADASGVGVHIRFEGGVWEMEDQRNWSDASFKTYVRPLRLPRPYEVPAGSVNRQAVTLEVSGRPQAPVAAVTAHAGPALGSVPPLWMRLAESEAVPTGLPLPRLAHGLILRLDPEAPDRERLEAARALAQREGLAIAVEALFPQRDPAAEAASLLGALGQVEALLVAARRDLRTRPSGTLPPGEAPLAATLAAVRAAGFAGPLGAGSPALFTEFNRNPPPQSDMAFFASSPLVHAADDRSVMETTAVLAAILDSAAAQLPGVPLWPGPLALAPPCNPYGAGLATSDGRSRLCMADRDPRHAALFGAAHLVAVLAAVSPRSAALAPLFASGPSGLADGGARPLPLAFVHAEVARACGRPLWRAQVDGGRATLGWSEADGGRTALVASLSPEPLPLDVGLSAADQHRLRPASGGWERLANPSAMLPPFEVRLLGGVHHRA
jgi:hypothetical protein